ncbi:MAG: cation diffusion facilitator family transporter [Oscillospiraceae bacterium]|nr:cation diffusion facilitator family transporter [Oscillospiraceae bacterium]
MSQLLLRLFVKNYQDTGNSRVREAYGQLAGIVGILCNLLLFTGKLVIGTLSGSVSITADAVNNLSDASSCVVTLFGFRMAAKPADEKHPYGHARIEYFSGLVVALLILVIGVELAKTSITKILHPATIAFSLALVLVLVLSIAVKLWMAAFYARLGKRISSTTLAASGADSRNDVLTTAAVLVSCLIGKWTGLRIDGITGLLVALFILYSGVMIAKDTIDPLIGAAPDETLSREIAQELLANPAILGIHDMMIHDYGPGRKFASVHAEMDSQGDVLQSHEILDEMERACAQKYQICLTIHYDPVVTDDAVLNRMKEKVLTVIHQIDSRLSLHDFRMVCGVRHSNLIFDLVVPECVSLSHEALKKEIDQQIQSGETMQYFTIIQFDEEAFNRNAK